jgi:uncharacterized protein (DUF697 family)
MIHARGISPPSLRIVASHSALAGLCPLIPLPFVDDAVIQRITRRMFQALFAAHGLSLTEPGEQALLARPSGWLRGAATSMALYPIKKLMRKVVYLLAIKDCGEVAASVFHDGWLLAHLLEHPPHGEALSDPEVLRRVREAMLRTYRDSDPVPLRRALTGAYLAMKVGAEYAVQRLRRREPGGADMAALSERMRAAAMGQWRYISALERRFRDNLGPLGARARSETTGESLRG